VVHKGSSAHGITKMVLALERRAIKAEQAMIAAEQRAVAAEEKLAEAEHGMNEEPMKRKVVRRREYSFLPPQKKG